MNSCKDCVYFILEDTKDGQKLKCNNENVKKMPADKLLRGIRNKKCAFKKYKQ